MYCTTVSWSGTQGEKNIFIVLSRTLCSPLHFLIMYHTPPYMHAWQVQTEYGPQKWPTCKAIQICLAICKPTIIIILFVASKGYFSFFIIKRS